MGGAVVFVIYFVIIGVIISRLSRLVGSKIFKIFGIIFEIFQDIFKFFQNILKNEDK